jgi:hypothetical protein
VFDGGLIFWREKDDVKKAAAMGGGPSVPNSIGVLGLDAQTAWKGGMCVDLEALVFQLRI